MIKTKRIKDLKNRVEHRPRGSETKVVKPAVMLGAIVRYDGGRGFARAKARGYDCVQIGTSAGWIIPPPPTPELFQKGREEIGIREVVIHFSLQPQLAATDEARRKKSVGLLVQGIERAAALKVKKLVMHTESCAGRTTDEAVALFAQGLNKAIARTSSADVQVLLETMPGKRGDIGARFEELSNIIEQISRPDRIGVCFDTCHVFAAGYDIRGRDGFAKVMKDFDEVVGIDKIGAFHLNGSVGELGSRQDRHCSIDEGCLGLEVFQAIVQADELRGLPMIVENKLPERKDGKVSKHAHQQAAGRRRRDVDLLRQLVDVEGLPSASGVQGDPTWYEMPAELDLLQTAPGAYILEFDLARRVILCPSKTLGRIAIGPGRVRYYGSACGGMRGRVKGLGAHQKPATPAHQKPATS